MLSWVSSSVHPRPTPRAVAREAGGGWCVVSSSPSSWTPLSSPSPPLVVPPSSPPLRFVVPPRPHRPCVSSFPRFHPASRCSRRRIGVVAVPSWSCPRRCPPVLVLLLSSWFPCPGRSPVLVVPLSSLFPRRHRSPVSTPRAVAHGGGLGYCGGGRPVVVVFPLSFSRHGSPPVVVVLPLSSSSGDGLCAVSRRGNTQSKT